MVEEARERVGLGEVLEARADLRVVDRERCRVREPLRELELGVAERDVDAGAVEVEDALDARAGDERDRDERLRLDRRSRDRAHARVEVSLVEQHGLAAAGCPPGDALVEMHPLAHDLVGPVVPREHRVEDPLCLVRLVDRHRLVWDEVGERVGDAHEQRVEALLGEDLVEDVRQPPVRLHHLEPGRHDDVLPVRE